MAKRSNNSLGRRAYGGKPYDANNSFVKKMATKVTDLIPQRSWISKWFNTSQDCGDPSDQDLLREDLDGQQPPAKRPRIRMDVTHPPGTFAIRSRSQADPSDDHDSRIGHETTEEYFLEPQVAGPSGACKFVASTPAMHTNIQNSQRSRPMSLVSSGNNVATNGADDKSESGESTSGCSSLIPQTNRQESAPNSAYGTNLGAGRSRFIDDKMSFANHLQSSPRCLFLEGGSRESLTSRRPSFNASMMTASGSNLDRTASLSSPFYSGNVTFGGSNAVGNYKRSRSLFNSVNEYQLKVPRRASVQVKPSSVNSLDSTGMSQTAKRILEAMEYFSSPISDAKKIPIKTSAEMGKKRSREELGNSSAPTCRVGMRHLTRELAVPTVPDMLKLRRRQRLQDTTVAARKIISAMSGPAPSTIPRSTAPIEEYHLRTEHDQTPKYQGKLRTKSKKNPEDEGPAPIVNLPNIALPITSLPSFEPIVAIPSAKKNLDTTEKFKFASPIKITEASWNLKSINNFSFSKPINPSEMNDRRGGNKSSMLSPSKESQNSQDSGSSTNFIWSGAPAAVATNFIWSGSSTAPRAKVKTKATEEGPKKVVSAENSPLRELTKLKSVESPAKSPGNSAAKTNYTDIWECADCYIKNSSNDFACVACKAAKPRGNKNSASTAIAPTNTSNISAKSISGNSGFGSASKIGTSLSDWATKAPATNSNDSRVSQGGAQAKFDLAEKFKPAEGSWECPGCMLRNPSTTISCPCCSAAKPSLSTKSSPKKADKTKVSGLMDKFKPPASTWECSSCLIRNQESTSTCVCCSNPKPGATTTKKNDVDTSVKMNAEPGWGDKFKKPEGCWTCDSCMIQNKPEVDVCIACETSKPGTVKKPQQTPAATATQFSFGMPTNNFKFGIDRTEKSDANSPSTNGFTFGDKTAQSDAPQFSFGIPNAVTVNQEASSNAGNFRFASPKNAKSTETRFGMPKTDDADKGKSSESTFVFGIQKSTESEKTNLDGSNEKNMIFGNPQVTNNAILQTIGKSNEQDKSTSSSSIAATNANSTQSAFTFSAPKSKLTATTATATILPSPQSTPTNAPTSFGQSPALPAVTSTFSGTSAANSSASTVAKNDNKSVPTFGILPNSATSTTPATFGMPASATVVTTSGLADSAANDTKSSNFSPKKPKQMFFGITSDKQHQQSTPAIFGITGDKQSATAAPEKNIFGSSSSSSTDNKLPAAFGTSEKQPTTGSLFASVPASSGFGASTPASNAPMVFGSSSAPVFGANDIGNIGFPIRNNVGSSNIFAAQPKAPGSQAPTSNPGIFTFGATSNQPIPSQSPASFGFATDNNDTLTAAVKPTFQFGSANPPPQSSEVFGAATAANNAPPTFGAPAMPINAATPFSFSAAAPKQDPPPAFGQNSSAIPSMFGQPSIPSSLGQQTPSAFPSSAPAPSAGFNFGAAAPAPMSGGFNFGASMAQPAAPAAPTGGFNFNAPASSPAVAFDPNTRPTFNFTGGSAPTTFNSTPQPVAPRKIKKAVRRMQQR